MRSVPALGSDVGEAGSAEAVAADEDEFAEAGEGVGEEGEVGVGDGHAFEMELLEPGVGLGQGGGPRREVGPPIGGHQIEVREARLALDGDGLDARETRGGAGRGERVAVPDEKLGSGERLGAVPGAAHQ